MECVRSFFLPILRRDGPPASIFTTNLGIWAPKRCYPGRSWAGGAGYRCQSVNFVKGSF